MQLRYGLLADYVGMGANNKSIVVGIFDSIFEEPGDDPGVLPGSR
jgi:hypothetical protein